MAACQRTWEDEEEGGRKEKGGERAHNMLGLREIIRMQGGEAGRWWASEGDKKTDRWLIWQRLEKDGEETDWWRLPLTVAWDGEVMCAKAVLDVWQRQGGMS